MNINPESGFTSPHQLADSLEAVVQRLRALPDTTVSTTHVELEVWVNSDAGKVTNVINATETVDLLGYAVTGHTGESDDFDGDYDVYFTPRPRYLTGLTTRVLTFKRRSKRTTCCRKQGDTAISVRTY